MALPRSSISLLCALVALLCAPASALAQDVTPPVNTTPATPAGWMTTDYTVALSGTDSESGIATMQWKLDGSAEADLANGATVTITASGVHTFETRAVDVEGNDSGWRSETLRIDKVLPIDGTDPGTLAWRPAPTSVQILAMDVTSGLDHVEWQLDGGSVQSGPNATTVPIVSDGVHTLRTRAVDVAGNVSVWRDHTVRVDTVTPTDTTAAPAGWQTAPLDVSVTGSDEHSGITELAWRLDGGTISTGAPPVTVTVSADGVHTLETRVKDAAGHQSGWMGHTIRIDTTAPANQTPAASSAWRATDYAVMVSGADDGSGLAQVEWRVDGGPVTPGPSPLQATVSGTGTHTLETRAVDVAGNVSTWRTESVRIDSVPPTNTTTTPSGPVANPYTVSVTGNDAHSGINHVEWRIDGGAVQSGPAASQATVTGNGAHTLETRLVDEAGNASAWRTDDVEVDIALNNDTNVPTDTTQTAPAGWRTDPVTLTISATDSGSGMDVVQWRIDGQSIATHSGASVPITISAEGVHDLETRGRDLAGNTSAWRLQTIRIDTSVPTDTTAIPTQWQASRNVTLAATDTLSGVAEIEYRINGGTLQHAANNQVINVGADGTFTIAHRAIDVAGQATAFKTDTLRVDTVLPVNTSAVPASAFRPDALSLALSGTDAGSGLATMQWRVDGGAVQDGGPAVVAADGVHTLETRAVDTAGNTSSWRSDTVRVDTTAPVNDTPLPPSGWRTTPYTVHIAGSDGTGSGVAMIERTIDGGPVSQDPDVTLSGDGVYELSTRIVDMVGHASEWRTDTISIDATVPVNTSAVPDSAWRPDALELPLSGTDAGSGVATMQWRVDGGAIQDGGPAVVATDGVHTLETRSVDVAGNASAWRSDTVRIDTIAPVNDTPEPPSGWRATPYAVQVAGSDDTGSGVDKIERTIDGGAVSEDPDVTVSGDGVHELRTRILDVAGNASAWRIDTIQIDSIAPVVGLACSPATGWSNHAVTCTVSANGGPSGLPSLTVSRDGGAASAVASGGAVVVGTDGVHTVHLAAADGAGNPASANATVRVDRTAPAATLRCAAGSGTAYTCRASGSDATSGLATLSYSLNAGAWTTVPAAGSFSIRKGSVRVRALDVAGNQAVTTAVTLADRGTGATKPPVVTSSSAPVYLAGHTNSRSLVGAMRAARSANGTVSLDLRPLAIGRGTFRVQIKLTSGTHRKTIRRTVKVGKGGTLRRMYGSLASATAKCTVTLTVRKRAGRSWRPYATSKLVLAG